MADRILRTIPSPFIGSPGDIGVKSVGELESIRDRAIHQYAKKIGNWQTHLNDLLQVSETNFGTKDWKTNYWTAKIANDNNIFEEAFPAAKKTMDLATTPDEVNKSKKLLDFLEKTFAPVRFTQAPDQQNMPDGYITLTPVETTKDGVKLREFFNPNRKKLFKSIQIRFGTRRIKLPQTVYLPFGEYTANGSTFKTEKGKVAEARFFLLNEPQVEVPPEPTDWGLVGVVGGLLLIGAAGVAGLISPREQQRGEVR